MLHYSPVIVTLLVISVSVVINQNSEPSISPPESSQQTAAYTSAANETVSTTESRVSFTIPAFVVSGDVHGTNTGGWPVQLWDGTFPQKIRLKFIEGLVIVWTGEATNETPIDAAMQGKFSMKSWSGRFSILLRFPMPIDLGNKFRSWETYSSRVFFKDLDTLSTGRNTGDTSFLEKFAYGISIILVGNISPNRTAFSWSGAVGFVFPKNNNLTAVPVVGYQVR